MIVDLLGGCISPSPGTPGEGGGEGLSETGGHPQFRKSPSPYPSPPSTGERGPENERSPPSYRLRVARRPGGVGDVQAHALAAPLGAVHPQRQQMNAARKFHNRLRPTQRHLLLTHPKGQTL